jgi:hypothetical protein
MYYVNLNIYYVLHFIYLRLFTLSYAKVTTVKPHHFAEQRLPESATTAVEETRRVGCHCCY